MSYLGGQIAIIHISKEFFLQQPLMLISTWDGDEFSLQNAVTSIKYEMANRSKLDDLSSRLKIKLQKLLKVEDIGIESTKRKSIRLNGRLN